MKVTAFFHGLLYKNQIILRATDTKDFLLIRKMFESKAKRADVRKVLYEWEIWRGRQETDFKDNWTVSEWRKTAVYSEASGVSGDVDCHHIVSRGSAPQFADCAWNVLALTRAEHEFFHAYGWNAFLEKYPHLRGKVERAFDKAGHLAIPQWTSASVETENLAELALRG